MEVPDRNPCNDPDTGAVGVENWDLVNAGVNCATPSAEGRVSGSV